MATSIIPTDTDTVASWSFQETVASTAVAEDLGVYTLNNNQSSTTIGTGGPFGPYRIFTGAASCWIRSAQGAQTLNTSVFQSTNGWTLEVLCQYSASDSSNTGGLVAGFCGTSGGTSEQAQASMLQIGSTQKFSAYWQNAAGGSAIDTASPDSTALSTGTWYLLGIVKRLNGATYNVEYYINGSLINTITGIANTSGGSSSNEVFVVGGFPYGQGANPSNYFKGNMAACQWSKVSRSSSAMLSRAQAVGFGNTPTINSAAFNQTTSGTLTVQYNGATDATSTATSGNYSLSGPSALTITGVTYSGNMIGSVATVSFTGTIKYGKQYTLTISGVKDMTQTNTLSGNTTLQNGSSGAMGMAGQAYSVPKTEGIVSARRHRLLGADNQPFVSSNQSGSSTGTGGTGITRPEFNQGLN